MSAHAEFKSNCVGPFEGKHIRLQRLDPEQDYQELYEACHGTPEKEAVWDYLFDEPAKSLEAYKEYLIQTNNDSTWATFVVIDKQSNRKIGSLSIINFEPAHKRAEIGGVWYTPEFHGTYANPESTLLLLQYLFDTLKYRRAEWKCNAKNIPSGKAAVKLGFTEEGIFRQHMIIKGVNRDSKYFSMLDSEWEEKKQALFERLKLTQEDKQLFYNSN